MGNEFFEPVFWGNSEEIIDSYNFKVEAIKKDSSGDIFKGLKENVKKFKFVGSSFDSLLKFKQIVREGKIYEFSDCIFGDYDISEVKNCRFTFSNSTKKQSGSLTFLNCEDLDICIFKHTNFPILTFLNCKNVSLKAQDKSRILLTTSFSDCENSEIAVSLYSSFTFSLESNKSSFKKIKVSSCKINFLRFQNGSCFLNLELNKVKSEQRLELDISDYGCETIGFYNCRFKSIEVFGSFNIDIEQTKKQKSPSFIDKLTVFNSENFKLSQVKITTFNLRGVNTKNIDVSQSHFDNLIFENFSVENNVKFNSIFFFDMDFLSLKNSILNGLEINPSFLHLFKEFEFKDSSLTGISIFNFKEIQEKAIANSPNLSPEQKIDFTRELSNLMIQHGNRYLTTVYKALEQDFRLESNNFNSKADKVILSLNSLSNSHGTRPEKAFVLIILLIIFQFFVINLDLYFQSYLTYKTGLDFLSQNYSYFIKPLTFLTEIEEDYKPFHSENMQVRFHPVTKGFDFLFKIFYAYLLYQFIAAFRKFNK